MKADLTMIGFSVGARQFRVAASATQFFAGEPVNFAGTLSSGAASVNTVVALTDNKPVIGTDSFVGVAAQTVALNSSGSVLAQKILVEVPVPNLSIIRGKAKVASNIATDSQLLGVLWDVVVFDLTTAVYTIDETAQANTGALTILNGDTIKGTLDVTVDARAMRYAVS